MWNILDERIADAIVDLADRPIIGERHGGSELRSREFRRYVASGRFWAVSRQKVD